MQTGARNMKYGAGSVKRRWLLANACKWATATAHLQSSRRRTTSENSGMILNDFLVLFLVTDICCDKNTPTKKAKSPQCRTVKHHLGFSDEEFSDEGCWFAGVKGVNIE